MTLKYLLVLPVLATLAFFLLLSNQKEGCKVSVQTGFLKRRNFCLSTKKSPSLDIMAEKRLQAYLFNQQTVALEVEETAILLKAKLSTWHQSEQLFEPLCLCRLNDSFEPIFKKREFSPKRKHSIYPVKTSSSWSSLDFLRN